MKYFCIAICLFFSLPMSAQHQLSAYGGWTASKLQVYLYGENIPPTKSSEIFDFDFLHSPYVAMEYEYDWKKLRLSTGLSMTILGTGRFWGDNQPWAGLYLNLPIVGGLKWNLPKNWGITAEVGVEAGLKLTHLGVTFVADMNNAVKGNLNAVFGLETNWKRFRLGTRLQVGLTDFKVWNDYAVMKHLGMTTYLGYTLWDAKIARERKAERLKKKQAE